MSNQILAYRHTFKKAQIKEFSEKLELKQFYLVSMKDTSEREQLQEMKVKKSKKIKTTSRDEGYQFLPYIYKN